MAGEDRSLELRAGAEIEQALAELAELDLPHTPQDVIAAVAGLEVPMWRGPTEGRVRVISPYRARARRVAHLFACSLQDGDFPRRDTGGPLLSDEARAALALPERRKAEVEDRYLFSVCLSRPKQRLWLSWRSADDEGGATARSPFVDEARELLAGAPHRHRGADRGARRRGGREGPRGVVFSIGAAPSEDELARAEAADGSATTVEAAVRGRLDDRLSAARDRIAPRRLRPGPLSLEPVLERLRERDLFGPSTLEGYAECPYRWFVGHELQPRRIGPEEEPLRPDRSPTRCSSASTRSRRRPRAAPRRRPSLWLERARS